MSTPLVSLLMGVHDGEAYLATAIDSVLAQSMGDLELIVVDDASSDATAEILAGYDDSRLVVLRNEENIGLTRSLNRGLAASRGRFVGRQDDDDRSLPERLERQLVFLEANPAIALCGTWARFIDTEGRPSGMGHPPADPAALAAGLLVENKIFHGSILARRELMEELGGYRVEFRYSQDYDLYLRALDSHQLANVPEELYELRFHAGAITNTKSELQHRFKAVARQLAAQRRAEGSDDLDAGVAIEHLLDAAAFDASGPAYWRHRALYHRLSGDLPAYRRALRGALRRDPRQVTTYLQLALSVLGPRGVAAGDRAWHLTQRARAGRNS